MIVDDSFDELRQEQKIKFLESVLAQALRRLGGRLEFNVKENERMEFRGLRLQYYQTGETVKAGLGTKEWVEQTNCLLGEFDGAPIDVKCPDPDCQKGHPHAKCDKSWRGYPACAKCVDKVWDKRAQYFEIEYRGFDEPHAARVNASIRLTELQAKLLENGMDEYYL